MKTIYRIFKSVGLALIALWMVSCQDLLTEDPKGQLAVIISSIQKLIWTWL